MKNTIWLEVKKMNLQQHLNTQVSLNIHAFESEMYSTDLVFNINTIQVFSLVAIRKNKSKKKIWKFYENKY